MSLWAVWQNRWQRLAARERLGVTLAAVLVGASVLWWLALAPALQTLRSAPAQAAKLEAQLQAMRSLRAQAQQLQAQPKLSREDALRALDAAVKQGLGASGQLSLQGERATVTLKAAAPQALAEWLALARVNARVVPTEARLQRAAAAPGANQAAWDGSLVFNLPTN